MTNELEIYLSEMEKGEELIIRRGNDGQWTVINVFGTGVGGDLETAWKNTEEVS